MSSSDLLQQAIAAANNGNRAEARRILTGLVEQDERNEQAWLWLAGVVEDPEDVRVCLENVLELNPNNERARRGLAWVNQQKRAQNPAPATGSVDAPQSGPVVETFRPTPGAETSRISLDPPVSREVQMPPEQPAPPAPPTPEPRYRDDDKPATPAPEPDLPCPYCGAPTTMSQRNCLRCKKSLEIEDQPRESRSFALTMLSGLWFFDGAVVILASLGIFLLAVLAYQAGQAPGASRGAGLSGGPIFLATLGFITLLFGAFRISVGRALRQRARWAYYVTAFFSIIGVLGALFNAIGGPSVTRAIRERDPSLPASQVSTIAGIATGLILCTIVFQLGYLALVALSYRDFFGPMRRFVPTFARSEHVVNYNNGIAYKNRGMWYMAMREWEMAIEKARTNITYLHALGLAYAQLGRFDRARATLDRALEFEPNNAQLRESRQLIDRMAAKSS